MRDVKKEKCNVTTDDDWVLKTPPSVDEVQRCEKGLLNPSVADFRFDFSDGYRRSRWNKIIIGRLVSAAIAEGTARYHQPVPQDWLIDTFRQQLWRARDAWAKPQPRGDETPAEAILRANQYCDDRNEGFRAYMSRKNVS